ncbi:hypothetical protein L7F22_000975 [Adiantum nelumboides]|nr:hypothetical protein [Adiantum nelumboides]
MFLQATGQELQEKLELLLEGENIEYGLKIECKEVEDVVSLLAKRQLRRDKMVVNTSTLLPTTIDNTSKPAIVLPKPNESMLVELVKGMREMKLKLARLEEKELYVGQTTSPKPQPKEGFVHRCIWCDSIDHVCGPNNDDERSFVLKFNDGKSMHGVLASAHRIVPL